MQRRVPAWLWLPVGMVIGLAAARLYVGPRILERWPAPGASVPATAEILISFDQAMDKASVLERLHVGSTDAGEVIWQGSTLIYRPLQAWASGSEIEVRLDGGARSLRGPGMITGTRWSFAVAQPRLLYLWPADGPSQVYARALAEAEAVPLTAAAGGVTDLSLGARGTRLVYIAGHGDETTELRELDLVRGRDRTLFTCPAGERCASPELSSDGRWWAFVRLNAQADISQPAASRVWVLEEGSSTPMPISPEGEVASSPFWSPQGWLAFVDSTRGAILVVDVAQGEPFDPLAALPSQLGERGAWSPDGSQLIYPDLILPAEVSPNGGDSEGSLGVLETHLYRWDVSSGRLDDLTALGGWQAEDISPSFTPDGQWVVFSRRLLPRGAWTWGRQLWRMRPDGSQAEPLTDEPLINHGAPVVGPQGALLAYLRFNMDAPDSSAEIWTLDIGERVGNPMAEGGYLPAWIP